jgi:hypothetical protein
VRQTAVLAGGPVDDGDYVVVANNGSPSLPNKSRDNSKKLLTTTDQRSFIHSYAAAFLAARRA